MVKSGRSFWFFAHRGASGHEPENTLRSVRRALAMGAPWVEVDVLAVDGEAVVIHDEYLERTTNGKGPVSAGPLSYLRSLDAGMGEPIPLLGEVLECVAGRAGVNVEIKGPDAAAPTARVLGDYLEKGRLGPEEVIVSSFHHDILRRFHLLLPAVKTGLLFGGQPRRLGTLSRQTGAFSVHMNHRLCHAGIVERVRREGLRLFVYTVNNEEDLKRVLALGVDGVFSDYPELLPLAKRLFRP
ncbi:MAG TPA: glycerophosphodiester phosphodiesterase family protein [Syntrophales bacterium]|nr:glycerophosphodiester phosphodiesterase family protein [Syntrophales bacterium]